MRSTTTLFIKKTSGEWEVIDEIIINSGKSDLSNYLRSKAAELINQFKICPHCVTPGGGEIQKRRPAMNKKQFKELEKIAKRMRISPSEVVKRFIIEPMLLPKPLA